MRKILILSLTLLIFIKSFAQLSLGFYYVNSVELCPLQPDIALMLAIGGVFEAIFFAAAIGLVFSITPARFKTSKPLTAAQESAKGSNGGMQLLLGKRPACFAEQLVSCVVHRWHHVHIRRLCIYIHRAAEHAGVRNSEGSAVDIPCATNVLFAGDRNGRVRIGVGHLCRVCVVSRSGGCFAVGCGSVSRSFGNKVEPLYVNESKILYLRAIYATPTVC